MLNYTTYVQQTANLMATSTNVPEFLIMLPGMVDYAEQRIYRELDPLRQQVVDSNATLSSGVREFTLPTGIGTFISVDKFSVGINPVTQVSVPLVPVSQEFLDITYPSGIQATGVPEFYAMVNDTTLILGPPPDAAYAAIITGVQRPTPLSSTNSSTYLTQYCPDLLIAASMVFAFGYMRDFGGQSDNPQAAQSWENQYNLLFKSAQVEQVRAKFQAEGWTVKSPSPIVTPPRV